MADTSSFRHRVKRARLSMGLTQDVLAERVGCATQTIRKIEGGQRRPSYQMAVRLAQVLGLPLEELIEELTVFLDATLEVDRGLPLAPPSPMGRVTERPASLPTYLTPFVGREREQAELARLLAAPDHRLITLVGPGGIGKTRLAVEVAGQALGFADGVIFVPLAPIREPNAIVSAIAQALAFTFSGTTDLSTQLLAYLRDKEQLLVLDNLEHLLGPENLTIGLLRQILVQAPRITVLATSREHLKLQAEWVMEIEGLAVPPDDTLQGIAEYPAFTLFIEHAQRVQHGFRLLANDEQAVAQICRLVGGMPLGLELAAAWVRVLSPQEIGQELTRDLDMSLVSPQDLPERHRSLQAVFDQSWHLLSGAEQRVLRKLAVFRGGCSREAAADIAGASLAVLATLVGKSLLRRTQTGHYDLHELIRQYLLARFQADAQEYTTTRDQHSAYYAAWLKQREQPLKGADQAAMVRELEVEINNIRAAWEWAVDHRRLQDIQHSSETLHWYCEFRSWFQEGEALFRQATDTLSRPAHRYGGQDDAAEAEYRRVLGQVLADHGYVASRLGQFKAALALIERSLALLQQGGDVIARSRALVYYGIVTYQMGEYRRSHQALHTSLGYARAGGDEGTVALCLTWLSMVEHALGAYHEAERAFREALAIWRAIGNPRTTLFCITFCSIALCALGKYSEAEGLLDESLALSRTTDDRWGRAMTLNHLGLVAYGQQEPQKAVALFRETLALLRTTGTRWELARTLNHLGMSLVTIGTASEAEHVYREALTTAMAAQATPDALQALIGLANVRTCEHKYETAYELIVYSLHHAATRIETHDQAEQLSAVVKLHLSRQQLAAIEEQMRSRLLPEVVTVLINT